MQVKEFKPEIFKLFDDQWALVTVGNKDKFNTMTVSWGTMGSLWGNAKQGKNVVTVFIKPVRYTHEFMEENDYFTVSFYKPEQLKALGVLGSQSGRDTNKVKLSGLTPKFLDKGITFEEATHTFVLHKIYSHDMDVKGIPQDVVAQFYTDEKPHTMYIGEVVELV